MKILVYKQSNFPINSTKIKKTVQNILRENGVVSEFQVDVAIVGEQKMLELVKEYYKEDPESFYDHPILTFPNGEVKEKFVTPEGETPSLGDIVISYPSAVQMAKDEGKLIEEVILELAQHGTLHLLGIHH